MFGVAFTTGLLGSLHCIGMCGPIALALPYKRDSKWNRVLSALLYNLGRISTYTLLGAAIGLLGKGVFLAGMQKQLSIATGILLLVIAIFSIPVESKIVAFSGVNQLYLRLKSTLGKYLRANTWQALYVTGLLNGLLPCGLVYLAIIGAVSTDSIANGAAYMALFGLGTLPLMLTTSLLGGIITGKWRSRLQKIYPIFLILFAALLIARGMNFEVPRTFNFWESGQDVPVCH